MRAANPSPAPQEWPPGTGSNPGPGSQHPNIPTSPGTLHPERSHPRWRLQPGPRLLIIHCPARQPRAVTRPWGRHSHILMGRETPARSGPSEPGLGKAGEEKKNSGDCGKTMRNTKKAKRGVRRGRVRGRRRDRYRYRHRRVALGGPRVPAWPRQVTAAALPRSFPVPNPGFPAGRGVPGESHGNSYTERQQKSAK